MLSISMFRIFRGCVAVIFFCSRNCVAESKEASEPHIQFGLSEANHINTEIKFSLVSGIQSANQVGVFRGVPENKLFLTDTRNGGRKVSSMYVRWDEISEDRCSGTWVIENTIAVRVGWLPRFLNQYSLKLTPLSTDAKRVGIRDLQSVFLKPGTYRFNVVCDKRPERRSKP
jgi:hypothetical protein